MKSGLFKAGFLGTLGLCAVIGCSATGDGVTEDINANDPDATSVVLPPMGDENDDTLDAGKPDAKRDASKDGAVDAGPPPPVPGDPCTTPNQVKEKTCGICGKQSTICLVDGATNKWSDYSSCAGELANGCEPGTSVDVSCGNCGTQKKTCNQFCAYSIAACAGQPANSCVPGSVSLQNAGCTDPTTFHQSTCSATCVQPNLSVACAAAPTTIEIGPNPTNISSTITSLTTAQTLPRLSSTLCPTATFLATTVTPYTYVQVHNPLAKAATVNIYNSLAPGGTAFKTVLVAYDGAVGPTDDVGRKACVKATTYGTTALTGDVKFASLDGTTKQVTIAAGATVSVQVAAYYAYSATTPADSTGAVKLNVATVSLQ